MAIHDRATISFATDETITEVTYSTMLETPMMWMTLYRVLGSSTKREINASFGELGYMTEKSETGSLPEDELKQQYKTTFVHGARGKLVRISRELLDDEGIGFATELGDQFGFSAARTFENLGAGLFNDAFNGNTYLGEDGLSLCNNAHVNVDGVNSQDNSGTNSLTAAGAKITRTEMRNFKGYESDTRLGINPDEILVPVDLEEDLFALIQSTLKPGTQNNDANIFRGRYTGYVWNYLTDTNAWFMMDSRFRRRSLRWYQRVSLELNFDATFSQGVRKVGAYLRQSHGFTDWRWVYGNNPS